MVKKDKRQRKQSEEKKEAAEKAASNRIGRLCLMDVRNRQLLVKIKIEF